jgi:hypothetical protein
MAPAAISQTGSRSYRGPSVEWPTARIDARDKLIKAIIQESTEWSDNPMKLLATIATVVAVSFLPVHK